MKNFLLFLVFILIIIIYSIPMYTTFVLHVIVESISGIDITKGIWFDILFYPVTWIENKVFK